MPNAGDVPLGVLPDTVYQAAHATMIPHTVVCLVTDGLFEVEERSGEMLGLDRLRDLLPSWWTGDLRSYPSACLAHLKLLQRDQQSDDRTLVVFTNPAASP